MKKTLSGVAVVLAGIAIGACVWLFWPDAWSSSPTAAVRRAGGQVKYIARANLKAGSLVVLPSTMTDDALERLTALDRLDPVWLQADGAPITNRGLARLVRLKELRGLSLVGSKVTDDGLQQIAALNHLQALVLDRCAITDRGLKYLEALPPLCGVSLKDTPVTRAGIDHLDSVRADLEITSPFGKTGD